MTNLLLQHPRCRPLLALLLVMSSAALLMPRTLRAEQIPVLHKEGTVHGFLVLRTEEGKELAAGDLIQVVRGNKLIAELTFHFKDGSLDDETTVYSQSHHFRLLSDHHVQKGPAFPHPMDVKIDASSGQVTVHSTDGGKDKAETNHLDLPPDLANGLLLTILRNIKPDAGEAKISYIVATPKPRLVKLAITSDGEETFRIAGVHHKATRYRVKIELGGIAGAVAPLIGKQPKDILVWVLGGKAPAFVRLVGQFYQDGPLWTVQLTSPVWKQAQHPGP